MLNVGQLVKLDNDKEYMVLNIMNLHNVRYVFLISNFKPLDIIIATEKIKGSDVILDEIKDNMELDYVLSQFALSKDENEFDE